MISMSSYKSVGLFEYKLNDGYDLIVVPCNYLMESMCTIELGMVFKDKMGILSDIKLKYNDDNIIAKEIKKKYGSLKIPMKDGDIRIVNIRDIDILFVKFPFRYDDKSYLKLIEVYKNLINVISCNEYKKVLMVGLRMFEHYGYSSFEVMDEYNNLKGMIVNDHKNIEYDIVD